MQITANIARSVEEAEKQGRGEAVGREAAEAEEDNQAVETFETDESRTFLKGRSRGQSLSPQSRRGV